jgi:hypothetical protein
MTHQVDTAVKGVEASTRDPVPDRPTPKAGGGHELLVRNQTPLACRDR